jgi:hypothetical protein
MRLPPCINMLCQKGMCIVSYRACISQGRRKSIARRTTRNDSLSLDRSSSPLRKGRRPASAGQRGFLKLQISHEKHRLISLSLVSCHLPCPSKPPVLRSFNGGGCGWGEEGSLVTFTGEKIHLQKKGEIT